MNSLVDKTPGNLDVRDNSSCFMAAARSGKNDTLRYLYAKHPTLANGRDKDGDTALIIASQYGEVSTVKLIIEEFQADVHELGYKGRNCFLSKRQSLQNQIP